VRGRRKVKTGHVTCTAFLTRHWSIRRKPCRKAHGSRQRRLELTLKVAVIIPHYNDVRRLRRCLDALAPQVDTDVEVVVADNASTEDLGPALGRHPFARVVTQPERGAGPARNAGVAATSAPWLMFIDADCIPAPDWIARGRAIASEDAVIGGRVDVFHETPPPMSGAEAFETVFAFHMRRYLEEQNFLGAGNLVTSRSLFAAVGGFRPAVSEDKEWSRRAHGAGFRLVYDHELIVSHPSRSDWPSLRRKWRRLASEGFLTEATSPRERILWLVKALSMPASILVQAPRLLGHPHLSLSEKARGLATLARLRVLRMFWMLRQLLTGRP
jgi:GT2 family glycosyltransferase